MDTSIRGIRWRESDTRWRTRESVTLIGSLAGSLLINKNSGFRRHPSDGCVALEGADEIHQSSLIGGTRCVMADLFFFIILLFVDWSQRVSVEVGPKSQDLFGHYFPREVRKRGGLAARFRRERERGPLCVFLFLPAPLYLAVFSLASFFSRASVASDRCGGSDNSCCRDLCR